MAGAHHLGTGGLVRQWSGPGEFHVFAVAAAEPTIRDVGDAVSPSSRTRSAWEETLRRETESSGLTTTSRAATVVSGDVWSARVAADGCYLMLVYARR